MGRWDGGGREGRTRREGGKEGRDGRQRGKSAEFMRGLCASPPSPAPFCLQPPLPPLTISLPPAPHPFLPTAYPLPPSPSPSLSLPTLHTSTPSPSPSSLSTLPPCDVYPSFYLRGRTCLLSCYQWCFESSVRGCLLVGGYRLYAFFIHFSLLLLLIEAPATRIIIYLSSTQRKRIFIIIFVALNSTEISQSLQSIRSE